MANSDSNSTPLATSGNEPSTGVLDWLRPTVPVALIALFAEIGYAVLNNSTLPVYLKDGLGVDTAYIGPIMMPFYMSELLKGPLGVLADSIGRKPLMVAGPIITIVTPLIFTLIHTSAGDTPLAVLVLFGFLRLLDGLGASALWPSMFAYLGDVIPQNKRSAAMSVLNVTYMVGLALGFLVGGVADDTLGPLLASRAPAVQQTMRQDSLAQPSLPMSDRSESIEKRRSLNQTADSSVIILRQSSNKAARFYPSFLLTSILFALATLTAVLGIGKSKVKELSKDQSRESAGNVWQNRERVNWHQIKETIGAVPGVLALAFVTFFGIGCIALQVKIFALDEFGITETQFGLLFLWPSIAIGALAIPLGHLADRWGQVLSIRLGFCISGLSMWALVLFVHDAQARELVLVLSGGLLGVGFVIAFPAWLAYLTTLSSESLRGTIIGAASTAQALGVLLGSLIGGWLYKHAAVDPGVSHTAPFIASATLLTCGSLLTFFVLKHPNAAALKQIRQ